MLHPKPTAFAAGFFLYPPAKAVNRHMPYRGLEWHVVFTCGLFQMGREQPPLTERTQRHIDVHVFGGRLNKRRQAGVPFWSNATLGLEGGIIAPQRNGRAGYFGEDKIRKGYLAHQRDGGGVYLWSKYGSRNRRVLEGQSPSA